MGAAIGEPGIVIETVGFVPVLNVGVDVDGVGCIHVGGVGCGHTVVDGVAV